MNLKKIYLVLITIVFSLTAFSQYSIDIYFKNYTPDGKYECYGNIINTVTLATQSYQFTVNYGPSSGGYVLIPVTNANWILKDLRVAHDTFNPPYADFSNYPTSLTAPSAPVPVYAPSGNNNVIYKADTGWPDGNHEYQFVIQ